MKKLLKFGTKTVLRSPLRFLIALALTVITIGYTGLLITYNEFDYTEWERDILRRFAPPDCTIALGFYSSPAQENIVASPVSVEQKEWAEARVREISDQYAIPFDGQRSGNKIINLGENFATPLEEVPSQLFNEDGIFAPYPTASIPGNVTGYFGGREFVWYSNEDAMEEFGSYLLCGRLPNDDAIEEIAVPQWLLNSFLSYGYRNPETGETFTISRPEDLLGKTLNLQCVSRVLTAKIVGVIGTEVEGGLESCFKITDHASDPDYKGRWEIDSKYWNDTDLQTWFLPVSFLIPCSRAYLREVGCLGVEEGDGFGKFYIAVNLFSHFDEYFDLATEWRRGLNIQELFSHDSLEFTYRTSIWLTNYSWAMQRIETMHIAPMRGFLNLLPLMIVFCVAYSIFLCISLFGFKRRNVGILQSLGASKMQLFLAFAVPLVIFCLLCSLGGFGLQLLCLQPLNTIIENQNHAFLIDMTFKEFAGTAGSITPVYMIPSAKSIIFTLLVPIATMLVSLAIAVFFTVKRNVVSNLNAQPLRARLARKKKEAKV